MSIKPCPACESEHDGDWDHGTTGPQLICGNPKCGLRGPCGRDLAEAEAAWNAMPRRPQWRSERPDEPGLWWRKPRSNEKGPQPVYYDEYDIQRFDVASYFSGQWAGPIPEPPAIDAGKEAAK